MSHSVKISPDVIFRATTTLHYLQEAAEGLRDTILCKVFIAQEADSITIQCIAISLINTDQILPGERDCICQRYRVEIHVHLPIMT